MLPTVKIGGSLVRNAGFSASTCLVSSRWFSCGFAVSMGEAAKPLLFECVQAGCHVVLRGRRGTFWHSNLFDDVSKMSKLEEASYEMLVFLHPRVLSRVAGFPVASPCLWGKLENISYSNVSKQVVMSFCVAGVALCDIPNLFDNVSKISKLEEVSHEMLVFLHPRVSSRVSGFPAASPCLWGKLRAPHSTLYTPHSTIYTLDSTLHTLHFTLLTLYSTLHTLHSTLYTFHIPVWCSKITSMGLAPNYF